MQLFSSFGSNSSIISVIRPICDSLLVFCLHCSPPELRFRQAFHFVDSQTITTLDTSTSNIIFRTDFAPASLALARYSRQQAL